MASEVGICNLALIKLGTPNTITALTDGTKNANLCQAVYEDRRDFLLRAHYWNFSIARVQLAQSTTAPTFGYDYKYALPADNLRVVDVFDNENDYRSGKGVEYALEESGFLHTNESEIYIRYVRRITDPNQMSADFREALSSDIANVLAVAVTQSNSIKAEMKEDAAEKLIVAKSADAVEDYAQNTPEGSWVSDRE